MCIAVLQDEGFGAFVEVAFVVSDWRRGDLAHGHDEDQRGLELFGMNLDVERLGLKAVEGVRRARTAGRSRVSPLASRRSPTRPSRRLSG